VIVEAIFWFHPLVWWIGARLIEERECACDEDVVSWTLIAIGVTSLLSVVLSVRGLWGLRRR
jgi:beta-lactamase regulating signal transducer with metallopeptidase domain